MPGDLGDNLDNQFAPEEDSGGAPGKAGEVGDAAKNAAKDKAGKMATEAAEKALPPQLQTAAKALDAASGKGHGKSKLKEMLIGSAISLPIAGFLILVITFSILAFWGVKPESAPANPNDDVIIKNGFTFPIPKNIKYYYHDGWGDCRGRSSRGHKGTDVMAPLGAPAVAVTDGEITLVKMGGESTTAGNYLTLKGKSACYKYMHMETISVKEGQKIKVGERVGTIGSSGNADAGAEHIHFQLHPGCGEPKNPFPYLQCWDPKVNKCP